MLLVLLLFGHDFFSPISEQPALAPTGRCCHQVTVLLLSFSPSQGPCFFSFFRLVFVFKVPNGFVLITLKAPPQKKFLVLVGGVLR